jgi:hypothetical protein
MRLKSRGEELETTYKCGKCAQPVMSKVDLTKLSKETAKEGGFEKNIKLNDNVSIFMDHITRQDFLDYTEWTIRKESLRKENQPSSGNEIDEVEKELDYTLGLYALMLKRITFTPSNSPSSHIEPQAPELLEDMTLDERLEFLSSINDIDYEKIKVWYNDTHFGVSLTTSIKCPLCQEETEETIQVGNFF